MEKFTVSQIAHLCYEANAAYSRLLGDNTFQSWENAPQWQKETNLLGVKFFIDNPESTPEDMHKSWLAVKEKEGWKYGDIKDAEKKEHPCILPYSELPEQQRKKDELFISIVSIFK